MFDHLSYRGKCTHTHTHYIATMQLYILQIPKPDAYIIFHTLTRTHCTCASIPGQTAWVSSTVQIYPKGLKSHQRLVKHWIRAELSLSEKTASEDNPTDSWRTLSRIQVRCFIFILLFVLFKSIVPDFKGNRAAFLVSLTDSGLLCDDGRIFSKYCKSSSALTLDEMKRASLGRHVFAAYSVVYLDKRSGTYSLRKGRKFIILFFLKYPFGGMLHQTKNWLRFLNEGEYFDYRFTTICFFWTWLFMPSSDTQIDAHTS